jgi:DNA polymerase III epsilon subunit-like protein
MIIVDIETTGIDPKKHAMVSIGAVDFNNPTYQFYEECRISENKEIQEKALGVNGFTEQQLRDSAKQPLPELLKHFRAWFRKASSKVMAGQNPSFDMSFLKQACKEAEVNMELYRRTVDLHAIAYCRRKQMNLSLNNILAYVGLPQEPNPHNALTGAKMEAEAFSRLLHKKNLLEEFKKYPVPAHLP